MPYFFLSALHPCIFAILIRDLSDGREIVRKRKNSQKIYKKKGVMVMLLVQVYLQLGDQEKYDYRASSVFLLVV